MGRLAGGQPLTYEYISQLEDQLTELQNKVSTLDAFQDIFVFIERQAGNATQIRPKAVQILAGNQPVNPANATPYFVSTAIFGLAFAAKPLVVASVTDNRTGSNDPIAIANVVVRSISRDRFTYRVDILNGAGKIQPGDLQVDYIAIGQRS